MSVPVSDPLQTSTGSSAETSDNDAHEQIYIGFPCRVMAEDPVLVHFIVSMINAAYNVAEPNYFEPGHGRTNVSEVTQLLHDEKIALASITRIPKKPREIVGCIAIYKLSETSAEFGMLVSSPAIRGAGTGLKLVQFAENHARDVWHCHIMQLKILLPTAFNDPGKEWLLAWYMRIGYVFVRKADFGVDFGNNDQRLATPIDYWILEKLLQ